MTKDNCVRRPFDISIEDPADGIGRAFDLHEQLMEVLNDDSLPCDLTNKRVKHNKKNLRISGMEVLLPCFITYLYETVL